MDIAEAGTWHRKHWIENILSIVGLVGGYCTYEALGSKLEASLPLITLYFLLVFVIHRLSFLEHTMNRIEEEVDGRDNALLAISQELRRFSKSPGTQ